MLVAKLNEKVCNAIEQKSPVFLESLKPTLVFPFPVKYANKLAPEDSQTAVY